MRPGIQTRLLAAQSDERLVALAREGHERAFEAVVLRYRRPLLRYCQRLALPDSRAEDVLQQALLNAWLALQRGAEVRELRPWLYRIVHNVAVGSIRREPTAMDVESLSESADGGIDPAGSRRPGSAFADVEDVLAVRDAFAGMADLPPMQREVMVRTAVGGHSHEEVADALGISDGAVRGLLYRARAQMRAAIAAAMPAPLLMWALRRGVTGGSSGGAAAVDTASGAGLASGAAASGVPERIVELASGAGGAGLAGLAAKGGIVALTAGAAITGAVVAHGHHHSQPSRPSVQSHSRISAAAAASHRTGHGELHVRALRLDARAVKHARKHPAPARHARSRPRPAPTPTVATAPAYVAPQTVPVAAAPGSDGHHRSRDKASGGDHEATTRSGGDRTTSGSGPRGSSGGGGGSDSSGGAPGGRISSDESTGGASDGSGSPTGSQQTSGDQQPSGGEATSGATESESTTSQSTQAEGGPQPATSQPEGSKEEQSTDK